MPQDNSIGKWHHDDRKLITLFILFPQGSPKDTLFKPAHKNQPTFIRTFIAIPLNSCDLIHEGHFIINKLKMHMVLNWWAVGLYTACGFIAETVFFVL